MRRRHWRTLVRGILISWLFGARAVADTFPGCVTRVYAEDMKAKHVWHHSLRDLITQARPDLATLATLDMDQQLALMDRRQAQFNYLVQVDPKRIHTREGLSSFRNFDWAQTDALILRQRSLSYVVIERRVADLARLTQGHPNRPALQDYFQSVLSVSPQFQGMVQRLGERESDVEGLLQGCPPLR